MSKLSYIRNEKGMALITVLMVFLVLVILLGATMFAAVTNQRNAIFANEHSEAYYVAESGINLRVAQMSDFLNDPEEYIDLRVTTMVDYLESMIADLNADNVIPVGNGNSATVTITGPEEFSEFFDSVRISITSVGNVNGITRTLQQDIIIQIVFGDETLIDKAIVSRGSVIMNNGLGTVIGAVLTNGEQLQIMYRNKLTTGPIFELGDVSVSNAIKKCANITAYGWPLGFTPNFNNLIFNKESFASVNGDTSKFKNNNCFKSSTPTYEPAKIFPRVLVQSFPTNPYPVSVVNGKITLPDLRRIPGGYNGYIINGNLNVTSNITVELGDYGYSAQLKRIIVNGNFVTSSQGVLNVTGVGRLVFMKNYGFPSAGQTVQWDAKVNPTGSDPAKVIFMIDTHNDLLPDIDANGNVTSSFAKGNVVTWSIANNAVFNASLIGENVNYEWSNAVVKGYIITNGDAVKLKANAQTIAATPVWIYAPVAHVSLESGAYLYGSVLAKAVEFQASNPVVEFKDMPPGAQLLSYMFYLQPVAGGGTNPDEAIIYFSNIVEIDNE